MVLPDGTMVSGDSTGSLQFWDGQHGTLLQAFSQHKADILAVAASKDGCTVFATGIDVQVSLPVLTSSPCHAPGQASFTNAPMLAACHTLYRLLRHIIPQDSHPCIVLPGGLQFPMLLLQSQVLL